MRFLRSLGGVQNVSGGTAVLCFGGVCEPVNPGGTATYGWVLLAEDGTVAVEDSGRVGSGAGVTNNVAEYHALGRGLRAIAERQPRPRRLLLRGSSQLVICQLRGEWQCNADHLVRLRDRCLELLDELGCPWSAEWVPRAENARAERLAVVAWEGATGQPFPEHRRGRRR